MITMRTNAPFPTTRRWRAALAVLPVAAMMAGCTGTIPEATVVTITSTVAPATHPAAPPRHDPSDSTPGATVIGGPATRGDDTSTPTGVTGKPHRTGPPTTITFGRPTAQDPDRQDGAPTGDATTPASRTDDGDTGGDSPPGSLSTDGDLIAAATSAAAAAGVAPADPDTPGPETGPACPADPAYVDEKPTGLRSDVIAGWHRAVSRAAAKGITLCLNDGKRSRAQQQAQYDDYVEQYGKKVADQLVLPPNKSAHVVGIAVDVQPADGYRWLQSTDGSLGFCRIYDNEAWHFEFNPDYRSTGCPARLPEPER